MIVSAWSRAATVQAGALVLGAALVLTSVHMNLGEALLEAGRAAEALPHLQAARDAGVLPVTTRYYLAAAHEQLGRPDRARGELAAVPLLADLEATSLIDLGLFAMHLEDPATAERFFREAAACNPEEPLAHHHLGVALALQNRGREALTELEAAVRLSPNDAAMRAHLAAALADSGQVDAARAQAQEALRLQPGLAEARQLLSALSGIQPARR